MTLSWFLSALCVPLERGNESAKISFDLRFNATCLDFQVMNVIPIASGLPINPSEALRGSFASRTAGTVCNNEHTSGLSSWYLTLLSGSDHRCFNLISLADVGRISRSWRSFLHREA
ncbi:hypothetical protein FA10DRAFT_268832 [Acaromyces ingoldii]|uniref:Uncharacterized protein n=1 Tax=Acaromyces ingoldii TaxID=215250 RepID=A0A316YJ74_9BASI|nr:hypothetical protein FA10DRAFT_268832 [Acaromyces ingoldii]PWN88668.1 hypothetical protein FA10DRAFT_268832 [Acaromyces ingoldii]